MIFRLLIVEKRKTFSMIRQISDLSHLKFHRPLLVHSSFFEFWFSVRERWGSSSVQPKQNFEEREINVLLFSTLWGWYPYAFLVLGHNPSRHPPVRRHTWTLTSTCPFSPLTMSLGLLNFSYTPPRPPWTVSYHPCPSCLFSAPLIYHVEFGVAHCLSDLHTQISRPRTQRDLQD